MSTRVLSSDQHKKRIRYGARGVSWLLAPLLMVALALWLLFNAIVCAGGRASPLELFMCSYAHLFPDTSGVFTLIGLGWLAFVWNTYAEEVYVSPRGAKEWRVPYHVRRTRHVYRNLDKQHQEVVWLALEMTIWASLFLVAVYIFYRLETGFLLGMLTIAALVRVIYGIVRSMMRRLRAPKEPPTAAPTV